ncbi:hypothetical protein [Carboxylicivirga sp. N1Y90]|uniref:hypothetical protein n=1 Tax=Carboxylicivirga fragile TaxID=3417571 RepID=UPI003D345202|nr:hypothetical protein [Marinilabiliaceae bacterium N1Y90]
MENNLNKVLESLAEWFMQLFFDPMYFLKPSVAEVQTLVDDSSLSYEEEDVNPLNRYVQKIVSRSVFKPSNRKMFGSFNVAIERNVNRFEWLFKDGAADLNEGIRILLLYYMKSISST